MSWLRSFFIDRWEQPEHDAKQVRFKYVYLIPGAMVALPFIFASNNTAAMMTGLFSACIFALFATFKTAHWRF